MDRLTKHNNDGDIFMIKRITSFSFVFLLVSFCTQASDFKVISLSPHTTELVYEAGLGDNLIAVSAYSDYPEQAKKLEQVANYRGINIERVISLKPDLIVAWKGGNPEKELNKLKAFGIEIFYSEPKSLADIANSIEKMGQYATNPETARRHAKQLRDKIAKLQEKYQDAEKISYFYQVSSKPLMTNNETHWPQALFSLCGGVNIFAKSPVPYPQVSIEQVLIRKPEVIFAPDHKGSQIDWYKWEQHIPAVKNKAIFSIQADHLNRPTSRAILAAEQICQLLDSQRKN